MSRPLNFRQIEAFRAVMLTGTTTGAARMLHTTQPSVSRLIGQMQAASGLVLFDMRHGRLRPTVEAHELFETVQRHFFGLDTIEAQVKAMRRSGSGSLRIACTPSLGLGIVPAAVSAFCGHYPDVRVNIQTLGSHYLRDGLRHGLFDVALSTESLDPKAFQEQCIHRSNAVCVMRRDHTLANRKKIDVRDLQGVVLLSLNAHDQLATAVHGVMEKNQVEPAGEIETTYASTICSMAARMEGVGIVNEYVADVFASQLRILPFHPGIAVEMHLAYPSQRAPSRLATAFTENVRAVLASLPLQAEG